MKIQNKVGVNPPSGCRLSFVWHWPPAAELQLAMVKHSVLGKQYLLSSTFYPFLPFIQSTSFWGSYFFSFFGGLVFVLGKTVPLNCFIFESNLIWNGISIFLHQESHQALHEPMCWILSKPKHFSPARTYIVCSVYMLCELLHYSAVCVCVCVHTNTMCKYTAVFKTPSTMLKKTSNIRFLPAAGHQTLALAAAIVMGAQFPVGSTAQMSSPQAPLLAFQSLQVFFWKHLN